jgi:eukaryotic-like serine/threonine-protein kinase
MALTLILHHLVIALDTAATGQNLYTYSGQSGHLDGVAWSPDSKRIASGSDNGTVQVWQAP